MKKLQSFLFAMAIIGLLAPAVYAQSNEKMQAFMVHEDKVKPSAVSDYEKSVKNLISTCKKYDLPDAQWITAVTDDYRYLYVSPLNKMADLDKNMFAPLAEKGVDLNKMFSEMDQYYNEHGGYVILLDKELSYMPDGMTQSPAGQDYREYNYWYTTPAMANDLREQGLAIKKMFEEKGSKMHYRVYKSGFGNMDTYYMVAIAAKNPEEMARMQVENQKLLGESGAKAFEKAMKYTTKYETVTGMMRPDLQYAAKNMKDPLANK